MRTLVAAVLTIWVAVFAIQDSSGGPKSEIEKGINDQPTKIPAWVSSLGKYEPGFIGDLRDPLDADELRNLAANPKEDRFRLKILICRAAADKDERFQYLLKTEGLRDDPWIDLPLAAYDYAVNGNEKALRYILDKHKEEKPGSDCDTVLVLSFVDEWKHSISAVLDHFKHGADGAAGIGYSEFWITRKQLYPKQFQRLTTEAEQGAAPNP